MPSEPARVVQIAPSIMCADPLHLLEGVRALEDVGVDLLHFDIMDAHFVPNMPVGFGMLSALREETKLPFDVHLMVDRNDWFIEQIAEIGAEQVAIHAESSVHLDRSLALIRDSGMKAGVALNPATPITSIEYVLDRLDFVLLMTVNPGYAGQKLVPATLAKIEDCRRFLGERGVSLPISVDGNVSFDNVPKMVGAGADILVAGTSSLYAKDSSLAENMVRLREAIAKGFASGSS